MTPVVRPGGASDVPALVELMFFEPSREAVALSGTADRARRFQLGMLGDALRHDGSWILVAEDDGAIAGFAYVTDGSDVPPLKRLIATSVRSMGVWGAAVAGWRSTARMAVDLPAPSGGLHLVELHVHPHRRGGGIGGVLLDAVEERAREAGAPHLSLTTGSANPARRLYERHGFHVAAEKSNKRYTRLTGVPGRVLMVKDF